MNNAVQRVMFSSDKKEWATPQELFNNLNIRFGPFTLDPCASAENHKCQTYFTADDDGLTKDWTGHTVFVNHPYGAKISRDWLRKCYEEAQKPDTKVVVLSPARTDTRFFHNHCMKAKEIHFIKGRIKFEGAAAGAPFPSIITVFDGTHNMPHIYHMDRAGKLI